MHLSMEVLHGGPSLQALGQHRASGSLLHSLRSLEEVCGRGIARCQVVAPAPNDVSAGGAGGGLGCASTVANHVYVAAAAAIEVASACTSKAMSTAGRSAITCTCPDRLLAFPPVAHHIAEQRSRNTQAGSTLPLSWLFWPAAGQSESCCFAPYTYRASLHLLEMGPIQRELPGSGPSLHPSATPAVPAPSGGC